MENSTKQPSQQELLKACADVLEEALNEYDALSKANYTQQEALASIPVQAQVVGQDGKPPAAEGQDAAVAVADPSKPAAPASMPASSAPQAIVPPSPPHGAQADALSVHPDGIAQKPAPQDGLVLPDSGENGMGIDGGKTDAKKKKTDAELMEMHKSVTAELKARGILEEPKPAEDLVKSEHLAKLEDELRKSFDQKFEALSGAVRETSELVKKMAAQPAPRRGAVGYSPVRRAGTEAQPALKKGELVDKALQLKMQGDRRIDTGLINRIETNRLTKNDGELMRNLGILG